MLKDIIDSGVMSVVTLKEIFRQAQESEIVMNAHKIVNVEQSMQRYLWLMAVSLYDAYGFGPERLQKFFEAFQENSDELAKMRAEVDDDYAFEKLRLRAEDVSRMDIRYYGKLKID